jgi:hypothetical protein
MITLIITYLVFFALFYRKNKDFDESMFKSMGMTIITYMVISCIYLAVSYRDFRKVEEKRTKIEVVNDKIYKVNDEETEFDKKKIIFDEKTDSSFIYRKYVNYFSNQGKPWLIIALMPEVDLIKEVHLKKEDWKKFNNE